MVVDLSVALALDNNWKRTLRYLGRLCGILILALHPYSL